MYQVDNGAVAVRIVSALLVEIGKRDPDLAQAVQANVNSALKSTNGAEFADAEAAAKIVRALTS